MKISGIIILFVGIVVAYLFRHDPVEGAFMQPIGIIASIGGLFIYFEGLKKEIISELKSKKSE